MQGIVARTAAALAAPTVSGRTLRWLVAGLCGLALALSYHYRFVEPHQLAPADQAIVLAYLLLAGTGLAYLLLFRLLWPALKPLPRRTKLALVAGALALGVLLGLLLAPFGPARPTAHTLEIVATGEHNPASNSSEVWLLSLQPAMDALVEPGAFALEGGWQLRDGQPFTTQPGALRWQGELRGGATLRLLSHDWSGVALVRWDGQEQRLDLYAPQAGERVIELPGAQAESALNAARLPFLLSDAVSLALLTLLVAGVFVRRKPVLFAGLSLPHMQRSKPRRLLLVTMLVWLLAALPIAFTLAPWMQVYAIPIELELSAPAETRIELCWDSAQQNCVPLVPHSADSGVQQLWVGELPPLIPEQLALVFRSPVQEAQLQRLALIDTRFDLPIYEHSTFTTAETLQLQNATLRPAQNEWYLSAQAGGSVLLRDFVHPSAQFSWQNVGLLWLALAGGVLIAAFAWGVLLRWRRVQPQAAQPASVSHLPIWLAFVGATLLHLLLVTSLPVLYHQGDTTSYMLKAIALVEHGTYDTRSYEYELNRLPGYPLFLAAIFWAAGYNLSVVSIVQALLFCVSVLALVFALRRWVAPGWCAIGVLLSISSPYQVWASRSVMAESLFTACSLLALAALIVHTYTRGWRSWALLMAFGVLATCVVFNRPNGIVLFAALVPICGFIVVRRLAEWRTMLQKLRTVSVQLAPYIATGLICVFVLLLWSLRNANSRGYFGPTDMTGLSLVQGQMNVGLFDVRALPDQDLYQFYLRYRYAGNYFSNSWRPREHLFMRETENGYKATATTISDLERAMRRMSSVSSALVPLQARLAAITRSTWLSVTMPNSVLFTRYEVRSNNLGQFLERSEIDRIINEEKGLFVRPIAYDYRDKGLLYGGFLQFAQYYFVVALALTLLAFGCFALILWNYAPELSILGFVFAANYLVNGVLFAPFSRYVYVYDVLLVMQVVLVASLLHQAMRVRWLAKLAIARRSDSVAV